ncbi:hypothetical protein VHA_000087 [Grimontia hollisae CIP 101886]|uniref:Uncharacterized protein n=1 Tax=Grimontia hollisae CIP 101886 TaxID=675812 RepID=D0I2X4_GRIHO|nr:hypothetical protein VHA_000087 [Grimontia hollisae CIP 101886]
MAVWQTERLLTLGLGLKLSGIFYELTDIYQILVGVNPAFPRETLQ